MKKQTFIQATLRATRGPIAVLIASITFLTAARSTKAEVLSPSSPQYGFSYQEWSAQWWQWTLSRATNRFSYVGAPDCRCSGPAHAVRFLEGAAGSITATRHITLAPHTPLFFPILSIWVDNTGCPDFTTNTLDQLVAEAAGEWSGVTEVSCSIDGAPVSGLDDPQSTIFHVESPAFSYTTAKKDNVLADVYGVPCLGGDVTIYPAVANGVFLMLSPFKPGKHTINFTGIVGPSSAPFLNVDLTYDVTVIRD